MPRRICWLQFAPILGMLLEGALVGQGTPAFSSQGASPTPAVAGVMNAFLHFPIVALEDRHGLAQEEDFYARLMSDPRFSKEVGNVVVEFGGAAQQATIDRYIAGEDVPYERLRAVWTDVVGWVPTVLDLGYLNVFAQIREVNKALAPSERIHVWLGEPPIDWSKIKTSEDWAHATHLGDRDRHPAELIKLQILAKHKKALVIYGSVHFNGFDSIRSFVENEYPNSFFVIAPYAGYLDQAASGNLEQRVRAWREQSSAEMKTEPLLLVGQGYANQADALLYLGPAASLAESPMIPDIYLDEKFRSEINRRNVILTGKPLSDRILQVSPVPFH